MSSQRYYTTFGRDDRSGVYIDAGSELTYGAVVELLNSHSELDEQLDASRAQVANAQRWAAENGAGDLACILLVVPGRPTPAQREYAVTMELELTSPTAPPEPEPAACPACGGTGSLWQAGDFSYTCPTCNGTGHQPKGDAHDAE